MLVLEDHCFFDSNALLDRLTAGAREAGREIVFVVGAPLTAPVDPESRGIADVRTVIELIREIFASDPPQLAKLDRQLQDATNPYQTAFLFLQGRRGQDGANRIIRRAVWSARKGPEMPDALKTLATMSDDQLRLLDDDLDAWVLSPGVQALGELVTLYPAVFGKAIITSNFDPLIEVAIRKAGGAAWRTALHTDGNLDQSKAPGCQVIHIHGYWYMAPTLCIPATNCDRNARFSRIPF